MPDTNFIAAFANNPLTLTILMIAVVVVVFIWKVSPYFKDLLTRVDKGNQNLADKMVHLMDSDTEQTKSLNELSEHVRVNTLDTLRITIYNMEIDPEDRLVAARRYFLRGGNGRVAPYVKGLTGQYPNSWKAILAMSKPEERVKLEKALEETV
jgi:hypothetical protein